MLVSGPSTKLLLKDGDDDDDDYRSWWKKQGFSQLTTAWMRVAGLHSFLWNPVVFMFFLFLSFGWFQSWMGFYVEHFVSNLNWIVYLYSTMALFGAAFKQKDWGSWLSAGGYTFVAFLMFRIETKFGTDMLRYLDNGYYADETLLPSLLYLFGIIDHVYQDDTVYEADAS